MRRDQLISLLRAGGFELKKWVSNNPSLLEDLPPGDRLRPTFLQLSIDGPVNELGVAWNPAADQLTFNTDTAPRQIGNALTKRVALAELARLFDPAGWLAPITVKAKMVIQDLWSSGLGWDDEVPEALCTKWEECREGQRELNKFAIPRWIGANPGDCIQLHAFADASRRAIAAVIYCRVEHTDSTGASTTLIWAKTKLAPARSLRLSAKPPTRMTIPRLELRAALLAARLLQHVAKEIGVPPERCHAWSDSRIVLHWLKSQGPTGNSLVDDYVTHIQELSQKITWRHVPTGDNPADVASRGCSAVDLISDQLWRSGPTWLQKHDTEWPQVQRAPGSDESHESQVATIHCHATTSTISEEPPLIRRFSSLTKLLRIMTRIHRLLNRRRDPSIPAPLAPLSVAELQREFITCVQMSQRAHLSQEIEQIRREGHVQLKSSLSSLRPFLGDDGCLRVGGRLTHSLLSDEEKHPVILSGKSHLAKLIVDWAHVRGLHGGFRVTLHHTLRRAWIINGRTLVRQLVRQCVTCAKADARPLHQEMAALPAPRVQQNPSFYVTGVDYAGPFNVLQAKGSGVRTLKGYIAIFVCFSSKAVHIELVGDCSTDSFLAALTRFIGRKGPPAQIWSDNGTNFKGANAELKRLLHEAELDWGLVKGSLAERGIAWSFIPPKAPHFGGLWETAVRSTKIHLRRVVGPRHLTYEELSTLLVDIERVLNSRPLTTPLGDLDDLEMITPAHLFLGRSLNSIPQPSKANLNLDPARHWELVRRLRDHFWSRWSKEYLHTLQQRSKWHRPGPDLSIGDVVIIIDPALMRDNGKWPVGRVVNVHPGTDGRVRVATVRTAYGTYTRPIVKLAQLPTMPSPSPEAPARSSSPPAGPDGGRPDNDVPPGRSSPPQTRSRTKAQDKTVAPCG
ncbi:hypothetical protein TKK_0010015 [Trichogramma kaykai]